MSQNAVSPNAGSPLAQSANVGSSPPERQLIDRAKAGDREALGLLFQEHQARAYRFGKRLCDTDADAEDAAQEALETALTQLDSFRGDASFSSWLFSIVRSRCSRRRRALARTTELTEEPAADVASADDALTESQLHRLVERSMAVLAEEHREVLLLRDVEGMSGEDTARLLGVGLAAMKSRLHRARAALKAEVERSLQIVPLRDTTIVARTTEDLATWAKHRASERLSSVRCAELERRLADTDDDSAEARALQRLLSTCAMLGECQLPPELESSLQGALDRWLARGD